MSKIAVLATNALGALMQFHVAAIEDAEGRAKQASDMLRAALSESQKAAPSESQKAAPSESQKAAPSESQKDLVAHVRMEFNRFVQESACTSGEVDRLSELRDRVLSIIDGSERTLRPVAPGPDDPVVEPKGRPARSR